MSGHEGYSPTAGDICRLVDGFPCEVTDRVAEVLAGTPLEPVGRALRAPRSVEDRGGCFVRHDVLALLLARALIDVARGPDGPASIAMCEASKDELWRLVGASLRSIRQAPPGSILPAWRLDEHA